MPAKCPYCKARPITRTATCGSGQCQHLHTKRRSIDYYHKTYRFKKTGHKPEHAEMI